jgi:nicotinamide-nucleotide amidase
MLMELARGPQPAAKTRPDATGRLRPRVARLSRRTAVKRRRPTRA